MAELQPDPCEFKFSVRWPQFREKLYAERLNEDEFLAVESLIEILDRRDRELEKHLNERPCDGGRCEKLTVRLGSTQAIPWGGEHEIDFDTTVIDNGDIGTLQTSGGNAGQVEIDQDGDYLIWANVRWYEISPGDRFMVIRRNDGNNTGDLAFDFQSVPTYGGPEKHSSNVVAPLTALSAGDLISVVVNHDNGSDLNVLGGKDNDDVPHETFLSLIRFCDHGTPFTYSSGGGGGE